jgi:hypothetical protein
MTNGIVTIAVKHAYYGDMAYNLAVSIKAMDKTIPIALIHDSIGVYNLNDQEIKIFDELIPLTDGWHQLRAKIPQITPFDQTLILDADQVWIRENPAKNFNLLSDRLFTCVNQGYYDLDTKEDHSTKYLWGADVNEMIKEYNLTTGKLWKMRGEFILFQKSQEVTDMFSLAAEYCANPKVKLEVFAGGIPDEWAIDIAMHQYNLDCHESGWQPSYWPVTYKGKKLPLWEMNKMFETLSVGGAEHTPHQKYLYDLVMDGACYKLGVKNLRPLRPKKNYIPERKKQNAKVII